MSIYIHEMGHVAWLARYGIKASAPMFIPGLGAMVRMKQYPQTPGIDARVGLAGPLWGLGAVVAAWLIYLATGAEIWGAIAKVAAWVNLFNLLPFGPLDGGRGFHALTKQERLLAAAAIGATWFVTAEPLLILLLLAAIYQVFTKPAEKPDTPVLVWYVGLIVALTAFSMLAIDPHAHRPDFQRFAPVSSSFTTALRSMVRSAPSLGRALTPITVRAGRWSRNASR